MHVHFRSRSCSGSKDGVALIMVLAFVVLLTILIISFVAFSRINRISTASYSKSIQAQEIAQGGLQDILGDLHQEIVAGSYTNGATYAPNGGPMIYVPTTNYTALPARAGYETNSWGTDNGLPQDSLTPTLIRVSRVSQDSTHPLNFYPPYNTYTNSPMAYYDASLATNMINRASAASTATPSANGRYVSAARWNKTFLLAPSSDTNSAANGSQSMPAAFWTNYTATTGTALGNGSTPPYGPPDWVYVTRTGSRVCTTSEINQLKPSSSLSATYGAITPGANPPASPVIGRYAFVMYDESALLDANVAGYTSASQTGNLVSTPSSNNPANIGQAINGKSYLAYADLTRIGFPSQTYVDSFVQWRNASSTSGGPAYLNAVFSNYAKNGFLSFLANDSPLLSRQDLINYFANIDGASFNTPVNSGIGSGPYISYALPYLGTFTRDVNMPSYSPPVNPTVLGAANNGSNNIYAYHDNAEISIATPFSGTSPNPNRDLANVRFANSSTQINHYDDTGTATTYSVKAGDPLLQSRFSLAKINLLSQANPATGASPTSITAIQSCFGLIWGSAGSTTTSNAHGSTTANGGNPCWNYVGSPAGAGATAATFAGQIETLDQVAKENREPNFFELLKASILAGSIGKEPGPAAFQNGTTNGGGYQLAAGGFNSSAYTVAGGPTGIFCHTFGPNSTTKVPACIPDIQIIQIGANIIDQYDSDSYPTAIYFRYLTSSLDLAVDPVVGTVSNPQLYGPVDMVYGDENLPLLTKVSQMWCSTDHNGTSGSTGGPTYPTVPPTDYDNSWTMASWYDPEIWNPHQQPATPLTTTGNAPVNFQIRAYGSACCYWDQPGSSGDAPWTAHKTATTYTQVSDISPVNNFFQGTNGSAETCDVGTLNFNFTSPTTIFPFYNTPAYLTIDQTTGVAASSPYLLNQPPTSAGQSGYPSGAYCYPGYSLNHFVAFCAGSSPSYFTDATKGGQGHEKIEAQPENTFVLGWLDGTTPGTGNFHPYCYLTGAFTIQYNVIYNGIANLAGNCLPDNSTCYQWSGTDPRTSRFSLWSDIFGFVTNKNTIFPSSGNRFGVGEFMPLPSGGFNYVPPTGFFWGGYPSDWLVNSTTPPAASGTQANYYSDPDGVVRPGDGFYSNQPTGDGNMLFITAGTGGTAVGDTTITQHARRPVILNRPFRSVGELGYAFRDLPFKTLDFFTQYSADAALLDVFSIADEAQVKSNQLSAIVAGRINPSNAPSKVLIAILSGTSKKEDMDPAYNMVAGSDAKTVAQKAINQFLPTSASPGPLLSRADLVTRLMPKSITGMISGFTTKPDQCNKAYFEAPIRALADVTNIRTWNLMIDVIAQSGHLAPNATTLDNFVVEGEKRYWLHIAIDRYTGKIIDQQLEPVYE